MIRATKTMTAPAMMSQDVRFMTTSMGEKTPI
jgi:hypothetical protein